MNRGLNIYKCSGVGSIKDLGIYNYWTAGTNEFLNTTAFNEQLAFVNSKMSEYEITEDEQEAAVIANTIDLHILILQGMLWNTEDSLRYPLERVRAAINKMLFEGMLDATAAMSDKNRAINLEKLVKILRERLDDPNDAGMDWSESDFTVYFDKRVILLNKNTIPEDVKDRLNAWFSNPEGRVGAIDVPSTDPSDYKTMSDYVKGAGAGFLYIWIDDPSKYSATIQRRLAKEKETLQYIVNNTAGLYTQESALAVIRSGIIETYHMTPERRLELLMQNGTDYLADGKVGYVPVVEIALAIISAIVAIITAIVSCIQECYKAKYNAPDGYEYGVPREDEDWNIGAGTATKKTNTASAALIGIGVVALLFFASKKTN